MESTPRPAGGARISSIDFLRGAVMIIMALDHTRDFFSNWQGEPTDLSHTTVLLFFTRWITHFCAPVFVFLAGTGAYMQRSRGKSIPELARFLWTRGLFLMFAEVTVVAFAWMFDIGFQTVYLQVIWVLGLCMIALSLLIRLPLRAIGVIGAVLVVGHNALDHLAVDPDSALGVLWDALHVQHLYHLPYGHNLMFFYPLLPWIGVMALGYVFGRVYDRDISDDRRRRMLVRIGASAIAVFIVLRVVNIYGDLHAWEAQSDSAFTLLSFLNTTKYPPSLLFLLMTLGPAMLVLRLMDGGVPRLLKPVITYGRVPMFYYVAHLYLLHAAAVMAALLTGFSWETIFGPKEGLVPAGYGFEIGVVYAVWIAVVVALYPVCRWYYSFKVRHRGKAWVSYV